MASPIVHWEHSVQHVLHVTVAAIEDFNARGMRRVYGRGDRFNRSTLNLDLWKTKGGRLLARFWARSQEVDTESWKIIGFDGTNLPTGDERWVPQCLRLCYDSWVISNA